MSTAIIALTRNGAEMARALANELSKSGEVALFLEERFVRDGDTAVSFPLPARPVVQQAFREHAALVLFLSAGATIRLLAPCLESKRRDPAVVCVDDAGKFCVSLLSGHLGGADRLAGEVARILGATPVITSASHASGTLAVDLLGREFDWTIEAAPESVTRASAAVVNARPVGIWQETGEPWNGSAEGQAANISDYPTLEALRAASPEAALLITDRRLGADELPSGTPTVLYRPRSLAVGMGCRRGVPVEHLEQLLSDTFRECGLALASLDCIATAELKRGEEGLEQLAAKFGAPLRHYSADELNSVFDGPAAEHSPTPSARAHSLVGVWGVAEPAALLESGADGLLVERRNTDRATIAVARRPFAWPSAGGRA